MEWPLNQSSVITHPGITWKPFANKLFRKLEPGAIGTRWMGLGRGIEKSFWTHIHIPDISIHPYIYIYIYIYIHTYIYTYLVYGCFLIILVPMKYLQPTSSHDFLVQNRAALLPPELSGWRAAHHWSPANFMPPNRWCWESLSYMVCSSDVNED